MIDDLLIQRMEGNDEIVNRVMSDKDFCAVAQRHLAREVYDRVRGAEQDMVPPRAEPQPP